MGRGSSGSGNRRPGGGGGVDPGNIKNSKDMISNRAAYAEAADQVLNVARDLNNEFGEAGILPGAFMTASFVGKDANVLGCYDGANIYINTARMDTAKMNSAMQQCADSGYHPSLGNKTGIESVAAHEFGHALTDAVGRKIGKNNIKDSSTYICNEARKISGHKGNIILGKSISEYASESNAETVAEALSDWYCNGNKAKPGSKAIVQVIKRELGQ